MGRGMGEIMSLRPWNCRSRRAAGFAVLCAVLATGFATHALATSGGDAARQARTVYLAPGGSDGGPCTRPAPCQTLGRGLAAAAAGDAVELQGGVYEGQTLSGDRGGLVTFRPAAGATVQFSGRVTLADAHHLRLESFTFSRSDQYWDLFLDACNSDVTIVNGQGRRWKMIEGNETVTFRGGSWGGYGAAGESSDSGFGTTTATGPSKQCGGTIAPPARNILIDSVTFHDVFWGVPPEQWGGAHPDCLEINGYVDGVTIRNSRFLNCGDSFLGVYTDQGNLHNIRLEHNLFKGLGNSTYFAVQIVGDPPYSCLNVVVTGNAFFPDNPAGASPQSPIRTDCPTSGSGAGVTVTGNLFARGPGEDDCRRFLVPTTASWTSNLFREKPLCGTVATLPWGYVVDGTRVVAAPEAAAVVKRLFLLLARRTPVADVLKTLRAERSISPGGGRWTVAKIKAVAGNEGYVGGQYGPPGAHPGVVARARFNAVGKLLAKG